MDANKWLVIVGLISALALGIGLVTSLISIGLGWRINNEQRVEIAASNKEAKDAGERAANALRDAGIANEAAAKANAGAAQANERAQAIENQNVQLRADLESAAADAQARIEAARAEADVKVAEARSAADLKIAAANERALATETRLEEERRTRLDLERWLAPRRIPQFIEDGHFVVPGADELKEMGRFDVTIETIPDAEPRRLANQILMALRAAQWNVSDVTVISSGMLQEGVAINVGTSDTPRMVAAWALAGFLTRLNIKTVYFSEASTPNTAIRIRVGLKPDTYFLSEEQKREEEKRENDLRPKVKPLRPRSLTRGQP